MVLAVTLVLFIFSLPFLYVHEYYAIQLGRLFRAVFSLSHTHTHTLKRISSIRRFFTEDATKTLVTSYILSRLDYCNCLLMGTPNSFIQPLQKIQNLQDFFSWHPVTTTQHLSWKNCTGFPFQNVLNIKSLVCVSAL